MTQTNLEAPVTKASTMASHWTGGELLLRSATFLGFIAVFLVLHFMLPNGFLVAEPRILNIHQNVPVLILALAAVVGLLGGAFDLSIAGIATLSTFLAIGLTSQQGLPLWLVLVLVVVIGALCGVLNSFIVSALNVNVIIATLGTGALYVGISAVYSGGAVVTATAESPLPDWYLQFGTFTTKLPLALQLVILLALLFGAFWALGKVRPSRISIKSWVLLRAAIVLAAGALAYFFGFSAWLAACSQLVFFFLIVLVVVWLFMDRTVAGRNIKATGSNALAARLAGVQTTRETYRAFVVTGILSSIAGICLAANQGAASPNVAAPFLLPAFAAAFLSTVIFSDGRFTVLGTAIAGVFVVWVAQGLIVAGLKFTWTEFVNGAVLIVAVSLSTLLRRRTSR